MRNPLDDFIRQVGERKALAIENIVLSHIGHLDQVTIQQYIDNMDTVVKCVACDSNKIVSVEWSLRS